MPTHVIYARKSTDSDDRQVLSIDSQIQELKLLAARRGISIAETLTERCSAKAPGRPVFGQLMRRVARGDIAGVLCWKMDRLARNHYDTGQVLQALADAKLPRVITPERDYTVDGNDRFLGNFEFGIATKFIDDLRANVMRGNRARFQRGWPNFRPPVGYLEDRATKTVVVDPDRFPIVRRMWIELLSGRMRPVQIARAAEHDWGLRTRKAGKLGGKPLTFQGIYKLLANPFYAGLIRLKSGASYPGAHKPMITMAMFAEAQAILGRPSRARPSRHTFAYAGLLTCGLCKGTLVGETHVKPSGLRFTYYRCRTRTAGRPCPNRSIPEKALEAQFLADLRRIAIPPRIAIWIGDNLRGHLEAVLAAHRAQRLGLESALTATARETDALLTLKLREQVDDVTFERRRLLILDRQATLRIRLNEPPPSPDDVMKQVGAMLHFSSNLPRAFERADPVRRGAIFRAICANPTVMAQKALYSAKAPWCFSGDRRSIRSWQGAVERLRAWIVEQNFQLPPLPFDDLPSVPRKRGAT